MRRGLCLLLGILASACGAPARSRPASGERSVALADAPAGLVAGELGQRLDAYLRGAAGFGFDGVVAVEERGEVVLLEAYGLADRLSGAPTTVDTLYALGSLSKSYTAALVLALASDGALPLTSTVGELVDDVPEEKAAITVEQLMTHTAGLDYHPGAEAARAATRSREALLEALLAQPAIAAPGERFAYSNVGYTVLALLCERAAGVPFEELVRARVLAPRGLHETTLRGRHDLDALPIARSWMDGAEQGTPREWPATPDFLGAGGVVATASDVLAWLRSLEPEQFEPRVTVRGTSGYAAGLFTASTLRGTPVVFHAGDFMGFNVEARWYPAEERRLVFLCNVRLGGEGLRGPVLHRVALLAAGEEVPFPPVVVALDAQRGAARAGRYRAPDGGEVDVRVAEEGLLLSTTSAGLAALLGSTPAPAAFTENTAVLLDGARQGDFEPARALLHPAVVRHETTTVLEDAWRRAEAAIGRIEAVGEPIHVARGPDGSGGSWVRLEGERGTRMLAIGWMDGRLLGIDASAEDPSLHLRPAGPDAFTSYDLFRDVRIDATFGEGGALELVGPLGAIGLSRAPYG